MISVITAAILSAVALDAASKVAAEPSGEHGGASIKFEDTRCEADRDAAPTQAYMKVPIRVPVGQSTGCGALGKGGCSTAG
ncbi:hypothetical protein ACFW84_00350 [Streptomyces anulatus]|uniref:hypothetical protein n=1 Tax=Streptomyces anulatus TaxID=1892 RepID=UPI0036BBBBA7